MSEPSGRGQNADHVGHQSLQGRRVVCVRARPGTALVPRSTRDEDCCLDRLETSATEFRPPGGDYCRRPATSWLDRKRRRQVERDGKTRVAIIPAGFSYTPKGDKRWHATVRFGDALFRSDFASTEQLLQAVEEQVQALSYTSSARLEELT